MNSDNKLAAPVGSKTETAVPAVAQELAELREYYRWRPIAEIHEDYGDVVLIHVDDAGDIQIGSNLDIDFEMDRWSHFSRIAPLDGEEYERLQREHCAERNKEHEPT